MKLTTGKKVCALDIELEQQKRFLFIQDGCSLIVDIAVEGFVQESSLCLTNIG